MLVARDEEGIEVVLQREMKLEAASDSAKMASTVQRQAEKSGGTIFTVERVEVEGSEFFAPASLISDMRREALEALRKKRVERVLEHRILEDDGVALYPYDMVSRYENVTNRLSEEFYRQHGAKTNPRRARYGVELLPASRVGRVSEGESVAQRRTIHRTRLGTLSLGLRL